MSQYQSGASDFAHTDREYNLCGSHGQANGNHYTCPYQHNDGWEQFVSYSEDTEFQKILPPTEPQDTESAPLAPIDSGIFE